VTVGLGRDYQGIFLGTAAGGLMEFGIHPAVINVVCNGDGTITKTYG
jgi:hypothetical protein